MVKTRRWPIRRGKMSSHCEARRLWGARPPRWLAAGLLLALVSATLAPQRALAADLTFTTPGNHTFTVPAGVDAAIVDLFGAQGGNGIYVVGGVPNILSGGQGGHAVATIPVTPGDTYVVQVGSMGTDGNPTCGGGGGGATVLFINSVSSANAVVGAGGGGGSSSWSSLFDTPVPTFPDIVYPPAPPGTVYVGAGGGGNGTGTLTLPVPPVPDPRIGQDGAPTIDNPSDPNPPIYIGGGGGGNSHASEGGTGGAGGDLQGGNGAGIPCGAAGGIGGGGNGSDLFGAGGTGGGGGGCLGGDGGGLGGGATGDALGGGGGGSGCGPDGTVFTRGVRTGNGEASITFLSGGNNGGGGGPGGGATPELDSVVLFALGALGLSAVAWRQRRRQRPS